MGSLSVDYNSIQMACAYNNLIVTLEYIDFDLAAMGITMQLTKGFASVPTDTATEHPVDINVARISNKLHTRTVLEQGWMGWAYICTYVTLQS